MYTEAEAGIRSAVGARGHWPITSNQVFLHSAPPPPQEKMDETMQRLRSEVRSMAAESEKMRDILLAFAERQSGITVLDDDHRESWNSP